MSDAPRVLWQSERPNANGHYWRIWTHGHVEVLPLGWEPGDPDPVDSRWPTDTPENRARAEARGG